MNIKELYITDINKDGRFWSKDKIDKLNDMFTSLSAGMPKGSVGEGGAGGAPGNDGAVGATGLVGATGPGGLTGNDGSSIWTRTTNASGLETISLATQYSGVILGAASVLVGATCDTLTTISTTTPVKAGNLPSALRIHAINDTGSAPRKHIRLKSKTFSAASPADTKAVIDFKSDVVLFDSNSAALYATNILMYDGNSTSSTGVAAFTDAGIVIQSTLTFSSGTTQTFEGDVTLSGVAAKWFVDNPGTTLTGKHLVVKNGLAEGNVEFKSIGTEFTSFPKGSILQVNDDAFKEHFSVMYSQSAALTTVSGQGKEVAFGRGTGPWAGWYAMNGQTWRSPIGAPFTGIEKMKRMNASNNSILGTWVIPSTPDNKIHLMGGGQYNFRQSGNTLRFASISSQYHQYYGWGLQAALGDTWGNWTHPSLHLSNQSYVCYLGYTDWVWYASNAATGTTGSGPATGFLTTFGGN